MRGAEVTVLAANVALPSARHARYVDVDDCGGARRGVR
jgi:hypothetical protein